MSANEGRTADCIVCRKHRGEFVVPGGAVYEGDLVYAGHAQIREGKTVVYLGYLMAEIKRHVPGLAELTDAEAQALGLLVARLSRALKASEEAESVYAFVMGDGVPHVHVHVVARYPGAPREYWGVRVDELAQCASWRCGGDGGSLRAALRSIGKRGAPGEMTVPFGGG